MMKFIHCADLHLDSKIERLPAEKSKTRREEILSTFERLVDYAKVNGVTAVIIAGDMFDGKTVKNSTKARVFHAIAQAPNVHFLYLLGNHDESFFESIENLPSNFKVFGDSWGRMDYLDVTVSGITVTPTNRLSLYDTLNLPSDKFNIVAMHGQIAGYKSQDMNAEIISLPKLKGKEIDYLALGHIHSFSLGALDLRGKYAYSGCLDGRGFDETGDKGFVLIDVDGKTADYKFISFSSRNLYEVEIDVSAETEWFECAKGIIENLKNEYSPESLIKVVLKGEHKPSFEIDKDILSKKLNEHFFFAKVKDKTKLKIEIEEYSTDKSVRGEFVRAVWESDLTDEQKSKVIMYGLNALKGEEI